MKKNIYFIYSGVIITIMLGIASCNHPQPEIKSVPTQVVEEPKPIDVDIKSLAMDIDPECRMSLKDGVRDTATVNGKLYGFCSEGCKTSFIAENTAKDTTKK